MLIRLLLLSMLSLCAGGCASLGFTTPFGNDPVTGGVNSGTIQLLQIPVPSGLQYFPSHSNAQNQEGVETYRGHVDQAACAINLYNSLHSAGWQLRMYQRFGKRGVYVYQKDGRMAVCSFSRQGMLTLLDVWAGKYLPDNTSLTFAPGPIEEEPLTSIAPEEYPPLSSDKESAREVEQWGVQEREL